MAAYYNEIDPFAAQWLRNLIAAGHIAPGDVDERSIEDVQPDDVRSYTQAHFFAGIGVWSYAFRLAGWPDDEPVWSGSCTCQPFSIAAVAHVRKGFDDARHLFPHWSRLIEAERPNVVFGEQVASKDGLAWLDTVGDAFEGYGYAFGAAIVAAGCVGADHIRKRTFFNAHTMRARRPRHINVERFSVAARTALTEPSDAFARARSAMAGDYAGLLPGDGVAVGVERSRTKGYGNAISPEPARVFIECAMECMPY